MNIFIDFDGVIYNTVESFVNLNNKLNNINDDWTKVKNWNFKPECCNNLTEKEIEDLFNHKELYSTKLIKDSVEYIEKLDKKHKVFVCTVGFNYNNKNKLKLLEKYLPNIDVITISKNSELQASPGKQIINMDNSIFIDDHMKNLESSNARYKILFQPFMPMNWNKNWKGVRISNWKDLYDYIIRKGDFYESFFNKRKS